MKSAKRVLAIGLAGLVAIGSTLPAFADGNNPANPDGATTGYEGQPGNQSDGGGGGGGGDGNNPANPGGATTGYEGQPGNQTGP
jgi:hypothetical protein